ncbi:MAG: hypothetical protein V5A46_04465 [Haloferacaceae archaeon]
MNSDGGPRRRLAARILRATASGLGRRPTLELAAVFLGVPALLFAVHLFPGSRAWSLSLAAESPFVDRETLWATFASSYVHVDGSHLLNNVGVYWITMAAVYPLSVVADWRRELAAAVAGYLLAVPLAVSWVSLRTLGEFSDYPSAGFSGINSAFLGFLVVVWFVALAREVDGEDGPAPAWALIPFSLGLAVAFAAPRTAGLLPPAPWIAALFVAFAIAAALGFLRVDGDPRAVDLSGVREFLFVFGLSVVIAGVLGSLVFVAPGTNVYAHLTGFVAGFAFPFLAFVLPRLPADHG